MAIRKPEEKVYCQNISIAPNACHYYYVPINGFQRTAKHTANQIHLENNEHDGVISYKGRKRLEKALQWLLYKALPKRVTEHESGKTFTFKINFITLTLPSVQVHSDQEITNVCLRNFLQVCRNELSLENYVWRAEAQANGNIHYHLVTDKFIHYKKVRQWWNQSTALLGYIDCYANKFGHDNPNSTDIHSVKHVKNLPSYLSKYMAKERAFSCIGELRVKDGIQFEVLYGSKKYKSESASKKDGRVIGHILGGRMRKIESKLWMCSRSLSAMKSIVIGEDSFQFYSVDELIRQSDCRVYQSDYITSCYGDFKQVVDYVLPIVSRD